MTEAELTGWTDPRRMLEHLLQGNVSDRKLRLFAVACCRRIWGLLEDGSGQRAVEMAEQFADTLTFADELATANTKADNAWKTDDSRAEVRSRRIAAFYADYAASWTLGVRSDNEGRWPLNVIDVIQEAKEIATGLSSHPEKYAQQALLLHDIFGNPFRPVTIEPAWLAWHDGLLASMARQMYESRDFTDMPILADALEEAGCTNADILGHCRSGGEHVRVCWVVDLVLGKS